MKSDYIRPFSTHRLDTGLCVLGLIMAGQAAPLEVGNRLQLFVDHALIESMNNTQLRLHSPERREVVFTFDAPWEGPESGYVTVMADDGQYRLYYRGGGETTVEVTAMATSKDGVHWERPNLGLYDFKGSKQNNIIYRGQRKAYWESHNFTPFKDRNPKAPKDQLYKALGLGRQVLPNGEDVKALVALISPDGIHWQKLQDKAIITQGSFDSQNVAFWDAARKEYVGYCRDGRTNRSGARIRSIKRVTSPDFVNWTEPVWLNFGDTPLEHFYVNAITPYFREPSYYLGFPMRFVPERKTIGPDQLKVDGVSDAVFISSRDGLNFDRTFMEAFIRPGPDALNWGHAHGNNTPSWGLLQTATNEISLYWAEHFGKVPQLRRGVLRTDGFVSVQAPFAGGFLTTKPMTFKGGKLLINYSTSAVGSVRVEVLDANNRAVPGFSQADALEIYGDEIERPVRWKTSGNLTSLAGQTIKLRCFLKDADLYSFRFSD